MSKESPGKTWEAYKPLFVLVLVLEVGGNSLLIAVLCVIFLFTKEPVCQDGKFFEGNQAHACNVETGAVVGSMQEGVHYLEGSISTEDIIIRGNQGQFLLVEEHTDHTFITRIYLEGTYLTSLPPGVLARNVYFVDETAVEYYDRRGRFTICYRYDLESGMAFPVRDFANVQQIVSAQ